MINNLSIARLTTILLLLAVALAGCGGGGGGGGGVPVGLSHAPSLSGLSLTPDHADQNANNGSVQVDFYFTFSDAGGDLQSITGTVYDSSHNRIDSGTFPVSGAGITSGYISGSFMADTTVAGNYTIEFIARDSLGTASNKVQATFTVIPVALLVKIEITPTTPTIDAGTTLQFKAEGTYDDNTVLDLTNIVSWSSSDTNVATINYFGYNGRAYGKNRGSTTIIAASGAIAGSTTLTVNSPFGPAVNYPIPGQYHYLGNTAIGDLNGDGLNDVAVVTMYNNGPYVYIYYQKPDHTLDTGQTITTDLNLSGILIADMNNDGLADLILYGLSTVAPIQGTVEVYGQDAVTRALGTPQAYAFSPQISLPSGLAVADLNNDGLPDIVAAGVDYSGNGVVGFLFQDTNGALNAAPSYTGVPVTSNGELHVADMNNDGLNDVVLQSDWKQLAIIRQVSPGVFSTSADYLSVTTNYWPMLESFALGDLNGDGLTDIATADIVSYGDLNVFIQDNAGLSSTATFTLPYGGSEIHIADMNGDGLNDMVLLLDGYLVRILYQANDHTFSKVIDYPLPTGSFGGTFVHQAMSIGDVTSDGIDDIVASWSNEGIFVLPRLP